MSWAAAKPHVWRNTAHTVKSRALIVLSVYNLFAHLAGLRKVHPTLFVQYLLRGHTFADNDEHHKPCANILLILPIISKATRKGVPATPQIAQILAREDRLDE